ncbi:hypothetical protein NADFUDRAFT_11137, partial [Nadsonia fulvescens var. elongata DSM 6958]
MAKSDDQDMESTMSGLMGVSSNIPDLKGGGLIEHADDAIDFEDEDELADEDLPDEEFSSFMSEGNPQDNIDNLHDSGSGVFTTNSHFGSSSMSNMESDILFDHTSHNQSMVTHNTSETINGDLRNRENNDAMDGSGDMFLGEEENEKPIEELVDTKAADRELLKKYFPNFEENSILKMNTIFGPKPVYPALPRPSTIRPCIPAKANLEVELDQRRLFKSVHPRVLLNPNIKNIFKGPIVVDVNISTVDMVDRASKGLYTEKRRNNTSDDEDIDRDLVLSTVDWENKINWGSSSDEDKPSMPPIGRLRETHSNIALNSRKTRPFKNITWDSDDDDAFIEGFIPEKHVRVSLDMNDTKLLFVDVQDTRGNQQTRNADIPINDQQLNLRYNISNDRAYDLLKDNYQSKVRATIGNLTIDHSMVALRLQSPHYKVKLSKPQMRSFHRPSFIVKPGTTIKFSKLKQRKRKRDKGKAITELLSKTTDLTLGDTAQFFMMEYSEEFPLALSNFGMGSKLINYYRKQGPDDTLRPKLPVGETHVLGVQDRSPFWNFGFVEEGNMVPTLYNRMTRAPVFKHEPRSTDFLLIRCTGGGLGQKYHIREIPHMFVVGQTFPVTDIPGPHSRKVTTASKNRLKMIVFRVLNRSEKHRLLVKDISAHFPDQNDMQNRQRLKEFMEYQRSGEDQGYWKIKQTDLLPLENSVRAMITPEDIALLEAMQVGQQHLEDSGYGKTVDDDDVEDQDGMSLEEQLAPWNITRNFINATQGKAMLQLHGVGDPSGCGEAFSFLRTSMKGGFKAQGESLNEKLDKSKFGGHSYNVAMQQKAYDDEIKRIWYAQAKSLNRRNGGDEPNNNDISGLFEESGQQTDDDNMSLFSHNSSATTHRQQKILRITRMIRDKNGTLQRKTEVIKDPNVIRAYVKRRQTIEDSQLLPDEIAPTDNEETNRRKRKILEEELARLQRNQERRNARKAMKAGPESSGKGIGKGKSTTRKCATCGAIGHIRTNKACPLY